MEFPVSEAVKRMRPSATLAAMQAANDLRAQGFDVIDLSVGEPDFDTPEYIKRYAVKALEEGFTKYTPTAGVKKLRDAIRGYYRREFGAKFEDNQIVASTGGKQAIFNAVCALVNPSDEVLIVQPYWVSFPEMIAFTGAKFTEIKTEETDFVLTAEQVRRAITERTKLIIINSPSNPSGRVIPPAEFRKIVEVCVEKGVYIISDECYQTFVYSPAEVFSLASLDEKQREYVCIAGTLSKTYAMTGWRIGFTIADAAWSKAIARLQSHSTSHPTSFVQVACADALDDIENSEKSLREMIGEYERRRAWLIPQLQSIEGFECASPEGAFYAFPNVRGVFNDQIKSSNDLSQALLRDAHVVVTDGKDFGADGFIRISYAASIEKLEEAVRRIKKLTAELKK